MISKLKKDLFLKMLRIRMVELEISKRYHVEPKKMRCPIHLSVGQESVAVSVCKNLKKTDSIFTAHRSHAHYLAKGGSLKKMIAELHGRKTGCAGGAGGSMHLIDLNVNILGAVPIVGSSIAVGVGKAWANKLDNKDDIVVIFLGDGATEEGIFFESLDFASLHDLKVIFVCENNYFSVYSHIKKRQSKYRNICKIAEATGIKSSHIKFHDYFSIYKNMKRIVQRVKKNSRPYFFQIDTFRNLEHCGPSNDDHLGYRNNKFIKFWSKNDVVEKAKYELLRKKIISKKSLLSIEKKISLEIKKAFRFALKSPFPNKKTILNNIYKN